MKHRPPTQSIAMTLAEPHGVPSCPPSEIGMSNKITAAVPVKRPRKSILPIVAFQSS